MTRCSKAISDTCTKMASEQTKEGAHILDVCVDYVGRDGTLDMDQIASRFATQADAPLVMDSTEPQVMEAGLQWIGGRSVLNSANLEDGEAPGSRLDRVFSLAREYGAAVICLLIDEEGQARDVEWKVRVAHRIAEIAVNRYGLEPSDLLFDALTFPLSTGDDDLRRDAMATMEAIRRIKTEIPGCFTVLGLSNVSFGLKPAARHVLNSVFLHECVEAGLDSAIVHASKIVPLARIPEEQRDVCLDLIYDRRGEAGTLADGDAQYDPLQKLLEIFADVSVQNAVKEDRTDWSPRQAAEPSHHRRRPRRPRGGSRRGARRGHVRAQHRQRHAARRDEGGRRAVRVRRDAASVRPAVGRDHEEVRRVPRAAHGEGRGRWGQGPDRARHGQG